MYCQYTHWYCDIRDNKKAKGGGGVAATLRQNVLKITPKTFAKERDGKVLSGLKVMVQQERGW